MEVGASSPGPAQTPHWPTVASTSVLSPQDPRISSGLLHFPWLLIRTSPELPVALIWGLRTLGLRIGQLHVPVSPLALRD